MNLEILYEDGDTIVVNKPFGVVVNRAESVKGETIQDWIEKTQASSWSQKERDDRTFISRSGICHRLDKETSGCLMIAKTSEGLRHYLAEFKKRKVKKTYTALVHGRVEPDEGGLSLPLKRSRFDREKWQVHYEGKRAVTGWKVSARYRYPDSSHWKNSLTLLAINLKTGRTHQIRVHMSFLGWPLFADEKYLNKEMGERDRQLLSHHFLHASKLKFHNLGGEQIEVKSKLPTDCEDLLAGLMLE